MTTPDTSTTEGKISVMKAFADGKKVELYDFGTWKQCTNPSWNWSAFNFRIKPEPLERWVNVFSSGVLDDWTSEECAKKAAQGRGSIVRVAVHMREVTE